MARCSGCSGDRCSCVIRAGANVSVTGAGTPTNPFVIASQGDEGQAVPTGTIVMYGGAAAPAGWLIGNGAAVSRVAYAALYAAIGTTFGAGDGSTTFNLPDFTGKFPIGATPAAPYPRGATGGAVSTVLTVLNIPQHSHTIAHTHDFSHGHTASAGSTNTDHLHGVTLGGGGHEHIYSQNNPRAGISGGGAATVADHTYFSSGTGGGGGHTHSGATDAMNQNAVHSHTVTVNNFNGSTGGSSTGSSGNYGTAVPDAVPTLPPYLSVNFLVKT